MKYPPSILEPPPRLNRLSLPVAALFALTHLAMLMALGISLHWNVEQARAVSEARAFNVVLLSKPSPTPKAADSAENL